MKKVNGKIKDFTLIRDEGRKVVVSFNYSETDKTNASWLEVVFRKNFFPLDIDMLKSGIINKINAETAKKILSGFVWNGINVWLSEENQMNFAEAQHIAVMNPESILPVTFKLGEDENGTPVYHEFITAEELTSFYLASVAYKNQCLKDGWEIKDSIDWSLYEAELSRLFPEDEE